MMKKFELIVFLLISSLLLSSCEDGEASKDGGSVDYRKKAKEYFNEELLVISLEKIYSWHSRNGTPLNGEVVQPIPEMKIKGVLEKNGCGENQEIVLLWMWAGGFKNNFPFIWYHQLFSIEQSLNERSELLEDPDIEWERNWLPLLGSDGEWYFVDCSDGIASPVYKFFVQEGPVIAYTNLTKMFETHAYFFDEGYISYDSEYKEFHENLEGLNDIHKSLNNGITFPYYVGSVE